MDRKLGVQSLFDELSATYDSTGVDFFTQIARALIRHARLPEGAAVLDLGCGAGAALVAASEAVGPRGTVLGIDFAPGMVERSRRAVEELALDNVRVEIGDAEGPPAPLRSMDAIVAAFHEWNWSTGSRAAWTAIEPDRRAAARAAVDDYLGTLQTRRGRLRLATAVRYTRALAP